jgi:sulfatase maturation enzyme AslB (radical SAM superfamily)
VRLETIKRGLRNLSEEDLQALAQEFAAAMGKASRPAIRKLELFVTEECNLRCDYCWVPKHPKCMTLETAKRSIDFALEDSGSAGSITVESGPGNAEALADTLPGDAVVGHVP